jgi:hypothetical protein
MHKDEPLHGMGGTNCGGIDKTSHICRFSHTWANPPRFGLCRFVQIFGFFDGLALSCRFILFGLGLFVESGDFASEVQGQF